MRNKKKKYKFTDEVMAIDAIISMIFGIPALLIIIISIVLAFITKGNVPDIIGYLLLAVGVMSVTGFIFGILSYRDPDGGILSKRTAVIISIIDMLLLVAIYFI